MKILFTGGGTGGHIFPIVAIAREIRRIYPKKDLEFYYLGMKDEFGLIMLGQEDFKIKTIVSGKIRRYFSGSGFSLSQMSIATLYYNIIDILFKIPFGFLQSIFLILMIRPQLIFSKGGSGSISVTQSARFLRIPVFLHESDIVPGLSNRITSKWAKKIFVSFPKTEYFDPAKTILVGNPIRKELLEGDNKTAGDLFDLTFQKPIILFLGGSQGAEAINDFVLNILNDFLKEFELIHICGRNNLSQVEAESQVVIDEDFKKYYHVAGFLDEERMKHALKVADFIITRSGSGSIFEIAALGKPSILVPLPSAAANHQAKNAYAYSQTGAAVVVEQDNLTRNFFLDIIHNIFLHPDRLEKMTTEALRFSKPMAAKAIAREILEYFTLE
ncbi:MAG: UDP-N-acetylglucosamine--N-acetylmuramyl-(pentapeptide) pyrophosphoryl-undecaprenol N-acetylglucosamine transferase [Candidatus Staskawiczbacteria bacterium]|nr:UDP-N-acetylglucosamine--N-acetylmuramyl-(pentapeptide) pyrophosphoryl-undecaprenol N-acetylglucosamine transferase [Candidatus Staskawiczbacteria bacterium]